MRLGRQNGQSAQAFGSSKSPPHFRPQSPHFSFGLTDVRGIPAQEVGNKILSIWNERVYGVRKSYKHLRTVVLIKSEDLLEVAVFEIETSAYIPEKFIWAWNAQGNLCGSD